MAKRIKPKNLLDNSSSSNESADILLDASKNNAVEDTDNSIADSNESSLIGARITSADKEKLDKYDALEKTVLELTSKNEMLEAKIAEYVEKLSKVEESTSQNDEITKLKNEIAELKKNNKSDNESKEVAKLKNECKLLRDEADGYLVKISELTFENANLTCQLEEASKKMNPVKAPSRNFKPMMRNREYRNNGYDSWN